MSVELKRPCGAALIHWDACSAHGRTRIRLAVSIWKGKTLLSLSIGSFYYQLVPLIQGLRQKVEVMVYLDR